MVQRIVLLILLMLPLKTVYSTAPHSYKKNKAGITIKSDTVKVKIREFSTHAISAYRQDPSFNYSENKPGITLWDRFRNYIWHLWDNFMNWIAGLLEKLFGALPAGKHAAPAMKYFIIALTVVMIAYILLKTAGVDILKLFTKKEEQNQVPFTESLEDIHYLNFNEAIEQAINLKNYKLAVRLSYLRCLKQLNDANLINWKPEKTNAAYVNELEDSNQRNLFAAITKQFEYVWYGDFYLDNRAFETISSVFQEFRNACK